VHKFYALGKNYPDPKTYAFDQLKVSFANFQKMHSDIETGNIKINFN